MPIATPEGQISSYVVNVRRVKDQQITNVRRAIGPSLAGKDRAWLEAATRPLADG